jgi:hypothetical protein
VTQALSSSSETRVVQSQQRIAELEAENSKLRTSAANAGRDEIDHLRDEHRSEMDRMRTMHEALSENKVTAETKLASRVDHLRDEHRSEMERMRTMYDILGEKKVTSEAKLTSRVDEHSSEVLRLTRENSVLHQAVDDLKTPAGRGRAGEFVLKEMLYDAGFEVEDTSMGTSKDEGYMDLIVYPKGFPDLRIAVESKNREKIDPKVHIGHFDELTREGITKGLFVSSIFISLRANTKKEGGVHHVHMLEDANGHATIPVSYLGTERGRDAAVLTRDVVQAHVCMHATMLMRFMDLRRTLMAPGGEEGDANDVRQFHDMLNDQLCAMLEDLNVQSKAVNSMQTSMKSSRIRIIDVFVKLCDAQRRVGTQTREPCWMPEFRLTREKVATGTTDAMLWKNLSEPQKKRIADHLGGRETFLKAARTDSVCGGAAEDVMGA